MQSIFKKIVFNRYKMTYYDLNVVKKACRGKKMQSMQM